MESSLSLSNNIKAGDYVQGVTSGGRLFNGTINTVFDDRYSIIPDGGKSSIPFERNQLVGIIKQFKRQPAKPKMLDKKQIVNAVNEIIKDEIPYIDLPLIFLAMGENSLSVRDKNAGIVVSVLFDFEASGKIFRGESDREIKWYPI